MNGLKLDSWSQVDTQDVCIRSIAPAGEFIAADSSKQNGLNGPAGAENRSAGLPIE